MDDLRIVGRISGLYSGNGELNVATYDDFPAGNDFKGPLFVFVDKLAVPLFIASLRRRSPSAAVIRFEDIDTPARAEIIAGLELFIPAAARPRAKGKGKAGKDFASLVGYRATLSREQASAEAEGALARGQTPVGAEGALEGEVTGFFENGANPLFEVTVSGKQIYIPAAGRFVERIDPASRRIRFTLPEGLLELYL